MEAFVRGLREGYEEYRGLGDGSFWEAVFVTRPGSGAFGEFVSRLLIYSCSIDPFLSI